MQELRRALVAALADATGLDPEAIDGAVTPPRNPDHGDLAFPCFALARARGQNPAQAAAALARTFVLPPGFARAEAAGPYLNLRFDRTAFVARVVSRVLAEGNRYGASGTGGLTIVVDFSSPNIAKPFHVGHLRSTLIGWSLVRILRFLGHTVIGINHLGDWGTQFGYVHAGCRRWGRPPDDDPDPIETLVDRYVRATRLKDEDPAVEAEARDFFRRLEAGDAEATAFWEYARAVSLEEFRTIYDRIGIRFDAFTGEAFFNDKMAAVLAEVEAKGIGEISDGAFGVALGEELGFALLRKADGATLYLTRDLTAVDYRYSTYRFDRVLYVVGAPQALHFRQLGALCARLGKPYADAIVHVPFGHVHGMRTRSGGAVALKDFLEEAVERALTAFREEVVKRPAGLDERAVAEQIALSAILFNDLARGRIKDVTFDWDEALSFRGDTGPYLQYAHARINGIALKAGAELPVAVDGHRLAEDEAYQLATQMSRFPEAVARAAETYEPSVVAGYLLELARTFSRSNEVLRVKDAPPEVKDHRFALFVACRQVLASGLRLLGIEPIDRM
ncbi:MAG: arginine--tRNA ligase [Planctomycetes bacterium]|nr:arginine--tRNA ligase [Planctomycetota bacterium]